MEPGLELEGSLVGGVVGPGIGLLSERGLDEALGLAVGLGRVGLGSDVLELEPFAGAREGEGFVAGAVVGHDAGDRYAEAVVIGDGGLEEGDRALRLLVRHDHGEGDARGVVDADMDELPAGAFTSGPCVALPPAVAGDAVADLVEAAELLDVDVDELARVLAFVAPSAASSSAPA